MLVSSRHKRQENGTESERLRRWQNTTDSRAVLFLVRKGPLGCLAIFFREFSGFVSEALQAPPKFTPEIHTQTS